MDAELVAALSQLIEQSVNRILAQRLEAHAALSPKPAPKPVVTQDAVGRPINMWCVACSQQIYAGQQVLRVGAGRYSHAKCPPVQVPQGVVKPVPQRVPSCGAPTRVQTLTQPAPIGGLPAPRSPGSMVGAVQQSTPTPRSVMATPVKPQPVKPAAKAVPAVPAAKPAAPKPAAAQPKVLPKPAAVKPAAPVARPKPAPVKAAPPPPEPEQPAEVEQAPVEQPAPEPAAPKAKRERKGGAGFADIDVQQYLGNTIQVLTRNEDGSIRNPKRAGSAPAARFAQYQDNMTIEQALAAGVTEADIRWDYAHEFIAIQ